ncbi:recombinase RecT [Phenylobacterium sp. 58.2.17]|uniref:recombinase RecT n=1 Tax=Phenylobacterium sp. 58.2.17 TaxID=2969306 RepID=UPI002264978D|nr:recombinase RecT [Phenylobacterium sp. 58.2.17]MCX7585052.1 recombinase RecT [Phenylobacterium sp. 58.2.17]
MAAQAQAQTNAVAKIEPRAQGVVGDVQRMEKQFALALPDHVSPEKFVRVVMTAINTNPDLQKADRQSVLAAAMKCAQDGLMPDGREAALVTYGNKASYLPMIAGVLTKVRRSGELETINAHVVYDKDVWSYTLGDEERIEHRPYMEGDRGKAIAVYAIAKTKDGGIYREVMSVSEVEQVRNVSRAKGNGPWVQWWGEMARKTVLRRLSKRLPMSTDLQQVFQRDDDHYDFRQQAAGAATLRRLHADFDEPGDDATTVEVEVIDDAPKTGNERPADDLPDGVVRGSEIKTDVQWSEVLEADLKKAAAAGDKAALEEIWARSSGLRNRLDKSNPERLAEIEGVFNDCYLAAEDATKGGDQ